jgi:S1-C subfamily serine protease
VFVTQQQLVRNRFTLNVDQISAGSGSGFVWDALGHVVTNFHVVAGGDRFEVTLWDGATLSARLVGGDPKRDIAVLALDRSADAERVMIPVTLPATDETLVVGQKALAIGNPFGLDHTLTTGVISALDREVVGFGGVSIRDMIQTDASINPGNSGGPLLDAAGTVIGINTAVERDSTGIGFAIPIDIARPIMQQALAGEELARPFVGIRYVAVDAKVKAEEDLSVDYGALIGPATRGDAQPGITPDSPADKAGLKDGDVILSIEGQAIDAEHPLDAVLTSFAPGQTIEVTILRGSDEMEVSITLGTRPAGL